MFPALRIVLASLAGIVIAFLLIAGLETLGHRLYPPPPGLLRADGMLVKDFMAKIPVASLCYILVAWSTAAYVGGLVAALIAGSRPRLCAGIIGGFVVAGSLYNVASISHPWWFVLSALLAIPLAAYAAGRTATALA
jgi:hypothetical protein